MRPALLLPGQGSQFVGMGRELAEAYPEARALYARADEALGSSLSRVSWEGPDDALTSTENAQPALLVHAYATWRVLAGRVEVAPAAAAGHSLGEFTAYVIAGTLSFEDGVRLVRRRGELMAEAGRRRRGTMAAVLGLEPDAVEAACAEARESGVGTVVPANFNAPGQVVVSGDVEAVGRAGEAALRAGARRVVPLDVSGAFHSPLMAEARDGLRAALDEVELAAPAFPVVANAWARRVEAVDRVRESLVEQLTSPVRWVECVEAMRREDPDRWLELGPGTVLSGLLRRIDRALRAEAAGDPRGVEALLAT